MSVIEAQQRVVSIQAQVSALSPAPAQTAAPADADFGAYLRRLQPTTVTRPLSYDRRPAAGTGTGAGGAEVVERARQFLGTPYVWGGESPGGFDCSGLVQYVFSRSGVELPRVSTDQSRAGTPVPLDQLQAGDLVFFGRPVDHVGIYAGDGTMVVAPKRGDVVKVQRVDLSSVTAARRVLPGSASPGGEVPAAAASTAALAAAVRSAGVAGIAPVAQESTLALPAAGAPYAGAIESAARRAGVDPRLVAAVAWTESGFRPDAVSGAGATGLLQLMPATARGLGADPLDPVQNLDAGARYLAAQLQRFGRVDLALAAYNAGPSAVVRAGGIPSYPETQAYVARVLQRLEEL